MASEGTYAPGPESSDPAGATRTAPLEIGIVITTPPGRRSAVDVEYLCAFLAPTAEGHPTDGDEVRYSREPRDGRLIAAATKPYQHPGTGELLTLHASFPYEQRCQAILVSIHAKDQRPVTTMLHLLITLPGFPHRILKAEEMRGWRCPLGVRHRAS